MIKHREMTNRDIGKENQNMVGIPLQEEEAFEERIA